MQGLGQHENLEDQPVMVAVRVSHVMNMHMILLCSLLHVIFQGFGGRGTTNVCMSQYKPVCRCWEWVLAL